MAPGPGSMASHRDLQVLMQLLYLKKKKIVLYTVIGLCLIYLSKQLGITWPDISAKSRSSEQKSEAGDSRQSCDPKSKIGYMVSHKTASTTLQHMLFRFGYKHGLNFAIPVDTNYYGRGTALFSATMVQKEPWHVLGYHIFAMHSRWNQKEMEKVLGPNTTYIATVRNPVDLFESLYYFAGLDKAYHADLETFAHNMTNITTELPRVNGYLGRNQMLWDFGVELKDMQNNASVWKKIQEIEHNMDLVLVADRFDESLILLKDLLCWGISDITYLKENARKNGSRHTLTTEAREMLKQWLWADQFLYDHFSQVLEEKVNLYGKKKMQAAVQSLQEANENVFTSCVLSVSDNTGLSKKFKQYSNLVLGYNLKDTDECSRFGLQSWSWYKELKDIQRNKTRLHKQTTEATTERIPNST